MRIFSALLAVFLLFAAGTLNAEVVYQKANANGKAVTKTIYASDAQNVNKIVFWFTTKSKESNVINITLRGPAKIKASVQAKIIKGKATPAVLESTGGWYEPLVDESDLTIKPSAYATLAATAEKSCDNIPAQIVQFVLDIYGRVGQTPTPEQICQFYLASADIPTDGTLPTPAPNYNYQHGYASTRAVLQADACRGNLQYLVKMVVNLDNVTAEERSAGLDVTASFRRLPFQGKKAASIKPESDGRFAPQPLLLINSTGWLGQGEHVNVYSWARGKPTMTQQLKVEDYVPYQGLILARVVATSALTGRGKATFEITNGQSAYSVCFKRVRVRQKVNGYP